MSLGALSEYLCVERTAMMREIRKMNEELGTAVIMITHDLGVVHELCDKVIVMYTGRVLEAADTEELFKNPLHPYTIGLMSAIPKIEKEKKKN